MRPREKPHPPYSVPTMKEVRELPANGWNVVSTFSGCGGSCLGFKMAGFSVLWANEFIPAAAETYRANHVGTILSTEDVREVTGAQIRFRIGKRWKGEVDVLEGSPPCASFSTSGKREKGWGEVRKYSDSEQRVDDLFFEYVRLIKQLKPRVFVAENVSGLVKGVAKGYFKEILVAMKSCGYKVEAQLLDAQWLGVPQTRQRVIFMGVRDDLGLAPRFPKPLEYRYTIQDALPWIKKIKTGRTPSDGGSIKDLPDRKMWGPANVPSPTIVQSDGNASINAGLSFGGWVEADVDIGPYAIGKEWDNLREGEQSNRYFNLVRTARHLPCPTVTASGGVNPGYASVTHPTEKRKFSIPELRRICSFPDDFVLTGSYAQQWERLGRSVPPLMMRAVARCVAEILAEADR